HDRSVRQIVPEERQARGAAGDHQTDQRPPRGGAETKRDEAREDDAEMRDNPQIAARIRPKRLARQMRPHTSDVVGVPKRRSELCSMNAHPDAPKSLAQALT